jgi:hypothetical protein
LLTSKEKLVCKSIAKNGFVAEITQREFLKESNVSSGGSRRIFEKLYNIGFIEEEEKGYRLSNPLLSLFLLRGPS